MPAGWEYPTLAFFALVTLGALHWLAPRLTDAHNAFDAAATGCDPTERGDAP